MDRICGVPPMCERHGNELHGYPCHACDQEYWRRHPTAHALLHQSLDGKGSIHTLQRRLRVARVADAAARAAYDGPHETTVVRAGPHGPVSRRWNALCTEGCGWSHFWLPSKEAADAVADAHRGDPTA